MPSTSAATRAHAPRWCRASVSSGVSCRCSHAAIACRSRPAGTPLRQLAQLRLVLRRRNSGQRPQLAVRQPAFVERRVDHREADERPADAQPLSDRAHLDVERVRNPVRASGRAVEDPLARRRPTRATRRTSCRWPADHRAPAATTAARSDDAPSPRNQFGSSTAAAIDPPDTRRAARGGARSFPVGRPSQQADELCPHPRDRVRHRRDITDESAGNGVVTRPRTRPGPLGTAAHIWRMRSQPGGGGASSQCCSGTLPPIRAASEWSRLSGGSCDT